MKNLDKILKPLMGSLLGFATLDGYRRAVAADAQSKVLKANLEKLADNQEQIVNVIQQKNEELSQDQVVVEGIVGRAKDSVEILKQDANNLITAIKNNNKELLDAAHKAFENSSFNTNEELKSIIEFFNRKNGGRSSNFAGSGSGGTPNTSSSIFGELYNFIYNSITNYNSLIDSLNVIELGALTHIIVSFIILICF
jgi:ABC-type transporter Mla subunit MlaD